VDVCPVKIPFTKILLHLRHRVVEGDAIEELAVPATVRLGAQLGRIALGTPWLYRLGGRLLSLLQVPFQQDGWLSTLPPPLNRWTKVRPFPAFRGRFRQWWRSRKSGALT